MRNAFKELIIPGLCQRIIQLKLCQVIISRQKRTTTKRNNSEINRLNYFKNRFKIFKVSERNIRSTFQYLQGCTNLQEAGLWGGVDLIQLPGFGMQTLQALT